MLTWFFFDSEHQLSNINIKNNSPWQSATLWPAGAGKQGKKINFSVMSLKITTSPKKSQLHTKALKGWAGGLEA